MSRKFAALDTSFLLALAAGNADCEDTVDWIGSLKCYCIVTPTVLQELQNIIEQDRTQTANVAKTAINNLQIWGFLALECDPASHGIVEIIGRKLLEKVINGVGTEDDGLVLAEAAFHGSVLLVTYRECLISCSSESLRLTLLESDVADTLIVSPIHIVSFLKSV